MNITSICLLTILYNVSMCHLSGQTNESLELRYDRETYELAKWGAATNNIQFGLSIGSVGPHEADKLKVATYLYNQSSSMIFGLWRLPSGYRLEMKLTTQSGEEIMKTRQGNAICEEPFRYKIYAGRVVVLDPKSPSDYDAVFDLRGCFKIKNPGSYILIVKARLYVMNGERNYVKLDLPEARASVDIRDIDLKR